MNTIPDEKLVEIKEAIFQGNKIQAIKLYREVTMTELVVAKEAVEMIEEGLRAASPERFKSPPKGKGCGVVGDILAGLVLVAFLFLGLLLLPIVAQQLESGK